MTEPAMTAVLPTDSDELGCTLHARHEEWLRQQYLRDEVTLARWEQHALEEAGRCDG